MNAQSMTGIRNPKTLTLAQRQAVWAYVFLFVPLMSRRAVDGVAVDRKGFAQCCRNAGIASRTISRATMKTRMIGPMAVYFHSSAPPRRAASARAVDGPPAI